MNHNTNVKNTTLEDFVTTVNDLGVELVIEEALRQGRKKQLMKLIDEALINKNEKNLSTIPLNIKIWRHFSMSKLGSCNSL